MTATAGQKLALDQLAEVAARSNGALEVRGEPEETESGSLRLRLSLATRQYRKPGGLTFRDRERLILLIPPSFPFSAPSLFFAHTRFNGAAHVQWGRSICLYQSSEVEWQPADGMFGFLERVDTWFKAAGAGELDPEDAPLHPPVAYGTSGTSIVIRADAPDLAGGPVWIGRAGLRKVRDDRYDLVEWEAIAAWDVQAAQDTESAAAILLSQPLPMEYPTKVNDLLDTLEGVVIEFGTIWSVLKLTALLTEAGRPARIVLGAPMRRKAAGEPLKQHLTVWEIDADAVAQLNAYIGSGSSDEERSKVVKWMATASVGWSDVLEDRPEIVVRRDQGTPSSRLRGSRVLMLGCGAIGSAVAELVVRAGAASLTLVDNGTVKPGILVRQRFADIDIGRAKATALKERLDALGLGCDIDAHVHNLKSAALSSFAGEGIDLIIDASASTAVAHRLELEVCEASPKCPMLSLSVSAAAEHGSVAVRMPEFRGGPIRIARLAKLAAFASDARHPVVEAFWPKDPLARRIQPEPGCSAPTFTGSAVDIDHHAAGLLNIGLARLEGLDPDQASMDLVASPWSSLARRYRTRLSYVLEQPLGLPEHRHGYEVLCSSVAMKGIEAELRRIARTRSSKVETGGLMFGEIDDSHGVIWIDSVSGPPPDSEATPEQFLCGTAGTVELAAQKEAATGGSSRFVGIWHTHPISRGSPSDDDLKAMATLLYLQPRPPRQVAMLIVGFSETRPQPHIYLYHRNDFAVVDLREGVSDSGERQGRDGTRGDA